ncbi:MAG: hypothetical protein AUJ90_03340 [Gallionellaceae bacterium CG1_02_60_948]|nr:MAG: hypothetical protein AUJ90_03340 [Gallionellaceae bacterium CG1_02_60_948]
MFLGLLIIFIEVVLVTALNYMAIDTYVSLDVLYCLPIIQAARFQAVHAQRQSELLLPLIIGFLVGAIWSLAEALVTASDFPMDALVLNIFTRGVTFTVLGKVVARLWKDREYGHKDYLTDLSNPQELMEHFGLAQLRSERSRKPYSLLYINIEHLGQLNDALGRQAGDNALHKVAEILRSISRTIDTVARISSAQFVLLLPETDEQVATVVKKRLLTATSKEFQRCNWHLSLSIGQATHIGKNRSAEELLNEIRATMGRPETENSPALPLQA